MRKIIRFLKERSAVPAALFLLVFVSGAITSFTFSPGLFGYDLYDYCEGVFWADATIRAGSVVNPDYIYHYVLPFGSNLIMAPFVRLFGISYLANGAGMLVFFLLYLAAAFHLASVLFPKDRRSVLLFVVVLSLFVYTYIGNNLLHHLLAYGIGLIAMLGELACVLEISRQQHVRRDLVLLFVLCLWSASNGFSAALSTLPVLAAFALLLFRNGTLFRREGIRSLLPMVIGTAAGILFYAHFDAAATSLGAVRWRFVLDDAENVAEHLTQDLPADYLRLFYYDPSSVKLMSASGLFMLLKLLLAFLVPGVPLWLSRQRKRSGLLPGDDEKLLELTALFVALVCLGQYAFMTISSLRYLFNAVLCIFLLCAFRFTGYVRRTKNLPALLLLSGMILLFSTARVFYTYPDGVAFREHFEQIDAVAGQEGLTRGYICKRYWKVLDLISEGERYHTTVEPDPENGSLIIKRDRIYPFELQKPQDADRYYVVASGSQIRKNESLFSGWLSRTDVDDTAVLIYDISEWDRMFSPEEP